MRVIKFLALNRCLEILGGARRPPRACPGIARLSKRAPPYNILSDKMFGRPDNLCCLGFSPYVNLLMSYFVQVFLLKFILKSCRPQTF